MGFAKVFCEFFKSQLQSMREYDILKSIKQRFEERKYNTHRDTMEWMLSQTQVGAPDLYAARGSRGCPLDEADFAAIAEVWNACNKRIDAMYGDVPVPES